MPRKGFLTPSTFPDLMRNGRTKDSIGASATNVYMRLALDWLDVEIEDSSSFTAMEWGLENEYLAREEYEKRLMVHVTQPGFRQINDYVGGTCDGLVGSAGGIEIKCPFNPLVHLKRDEQMDAYYWQLIGYLWVYELDWIDFVSFDPRYSRDRQLIVERVMRDEAEIEKLQKRCEWAYGEAQRFIESLQSIKFVV